MCWRDPDLDSVSDGKYTGVPDGVKAGCCGRPNVLGVVTCETAEGSSRSFDGFKEVGRVIEVGGRELVFGGSSVHLSVESCTSADAKEDLMRRGTTEGLVDGRIVGVANTRCKLGPPSVVIVVQNPHAAVPKPPEYFNSAIGLGIMSEGRRGVGVSSFRQQFHSFRKEFLGCIRVDDRGGTMNEYHSVEKGLMNEVASLSGSGITMT